MQLTIGTQNSDRTTLISDASWEEYQNLSLPNCLVSFRQGVITIVSPGKNHEIISDLIRAAIWGYCRKTNVLPFTFNQTRLTYVGKEGKEPDVAYSFGEDKERPDLAVEVNLTSGNIDDLTKYQYLNIPEVWIWEQNRIGFFVKAQRGYSEVTTSDCLPGLESDRLTEMINASFGKSPLEVEQLFEN
jgi:Uma2 family endonuclease